MSSNDYVRQTAPLKVYACRVSQPGRMNDADGLAPYANDAHAEPSPFVPFSRPITQSARVFVARLKAEGKL